MYDKSSRNLRHCAYYCILRYECYKLFLCHAQIHKSEQKSTLRLSIFKRILITDYACYSCQFTHTKTEKKHVSHKKVTFKS